jgi:acetoin utilization protein AcuB
MQSKGDAMLARELMTKNPATIEPDSKLREAVEMLNTLDVRHLPVTNEDGELVGILSDRDLRALEVPLFVGDEYMGSRVKAALEASVSSIMNGDVVAVDEETSEEDIVECLLNHKIGAVPVTDAYGVLVGIVSYVDVLRAAQRRNCAA